MGLRLKSWYISPCSVDNLTIPAEGPLLPSTVFTPGETIGFVGRPTMGCGDGMRWLWLKQIASGQIRYPLVMSTVFELENGHRNSEFSRLHPFTMVIVQYCP